MPNDLGEDDSTQWHEHIGKLVSEEVRKQCAVRNSLDSAPEVKELLGEGASRQLLVAGEETTRELREVREKLKAHKNSPVKIFINCKNARRKVVADVVHTKQHLQNL